MAADPTATTTDHLPDLPLPLFKSETIPPSPNQFHSSVDFLPNFLNSSWIAYGASSLLVIQQFPQTLATHRQVLELSDHHESSVVKSVAWSPVVPSDGEVAVAIENCICLCGESDRSNGGIFCWIQIAVLVQSFAVESIKWTGSGDGIISAGIEVVLWKRKSRTWEIAWKFKAEQPQTMVSAAWSTEGPVATAAHSNGSSSLDREASTCVLVCQKDGKSGLVRAELRHPWPVSMIQWRPLTGTHSQRDVLLTCCLDGTLRLWCEIDNGRAKRVGKDINEQKGGRHTFHVTAVFEVNQTIAGTLGTDTIVTWAAELNVIFNRGERVKQCSSNDGSEYATPGRCEWLIGFGPGTSLTFWAVHCLDDISPLRFPRVTLWKRLDLPGFEGQFSQTYSKNQSLFPKATISRSMLFSPPTTCSLFQLFPDNSISWSQLSLESSNIKEELLSLDGHTGNILQVALHPYNCEVELAASLDLNGLLLFWSLSTVPNCIFGMPSVVLPTWKLIGRMITEDLTSAQYSSLRWAPSAIDGYSILLMGHSGGIDCFMVKISEVKKIVYHKLCVIPLTGCYDMDGPTSIFALPLPCNCRKTFTSNKFMLLGVWMKEFQALSWSITLHSDDLSRNDCDCSFHDGETANYESIVDGKKYCVVAVPCSSKFPDPLNHDQVTSVAVVSPGSMMPSIQQKTVPANGLSSQAYHIATGCSDGTVKLWRSSNAKSSCPQSGTDHLPWEIVGTFQAHQDPVTAIALSSCGRKISTICQNNHMENVNTLYIWESVHVTSAGNFLLEDSISFDGAIVAINWLAVGNGQLLLAVCMQKELRIYAERRYDGQLTVKSGKLSETNIWCCIAFCQTSLAVQDFLWGPGSTPVLVHDRYFCVFSKWSFLMNKKHQADCGAQFSNDNNLHRIGGTDKYIDIFSDGHVCDIKELSLDEESKKSKFMLPSEIKVKIDNPMCNFFSTMAQHQCHSGLKTCSWNMLDVAESLRGPLPVYHPEALLMNLYSGNLRRARVGVRHLVQNITSCHTFGACEKRYYPMRPDHIIPQMHLSNYFEEPHFTSSGHNCSQLSRDSALVTSVQFQSSSMQFTAYNSDTNGCSNAITSASGKSEMSGFIETVEKSHRITTILKLDRMRMLAVLDLLSEVGDPNSVSPYKTLDESGRRFWVAVRFQQLYFVRRVGRSAILAELVVDSYLMGWAFHSDCQDILIGSFLSNEPSWNEMRNLGMGFWFTNTTQLRTRMEKLARSQYLKKKDPKDCALLYIALNRLQVLVGLFKISRDEKDKPLVGFLARNFQEEKNKEAALKNAYVLMGRHQLDLAIAFFLLGGDTSSAVNVCAKNLGDVQLALVICRLIEGYGGPLERHLITRFLLPAASEKGDFWLASLFEWAMGNYSLSIMKLLGCQSDSVFSKSVLRFNQDAFLDPKVGQYCLVLATKNVMKNCVGEFAVLTLARWATFMTSIALNRCGLPLEALECLSSTMSSLEAKDERSASDPGNHKFLQDLFAVNPSGTSTWMSGDVALHLEYQHKLNLALQYVSKLTMEHPSWPDTILASSTSLDCNEEDRDCQHELSLKTFQHKYDVGVRIFEQMYSINSTDLMNMIIVFACNSGSLFTGYHIIHGHKSGEYPHDENQALESICIYPPISKLYLKATEEISCLCSQYLLVCTMSCSPPVSSSCECKVFETDKSGQLYTWDVYVQAIVHSVKSLRATLKMYCPGFNQEDSIVKAIIALDLIEYYIFFASAWLQKNIKLVILMIHPLLNAHIDGHTPSEIDMGNLKKHLCQCVGFMIHEPLTKGRQHEQSGLIIGSIPEDDRWLVVGVCLWKLLFKFTIDHLNSSSYITEDEYPSRSPSSRVSLKFENVRSECDRNSTVMFFKEVPVFVSKVLKNTLACILSSHVKQLGSFLCQSVQKGILVPTLSWLEESNQSQSRTPCSHFNQGIDSFQLINNENGASLFETLWEISADPEEILEGFTQEKIDWLQFINQKSAKVSWTDVGSYMMGPNETGDTTAYSGSSSYASGGDELPRGRPLEDSHSCLNSKQKNASSSIKESICFQNPEEIYKRNGELLEAMCINSIDQQQAALASNRKGILFFNWKDEEPSKYQSQYIWSDTDWPHNGWAGYESTPPTFVSPGSASGSKKGIHLGLGEEAIGLGSSAKPARDLTGGGAFGIPGYAGIGASALGWSTQEDFDEFVDPPATIRNISTRALFSHPSRPFFLAGSSNTHVYLWEFGKEKATATYGVLPAANVPPPYALPSISALQFDRYGHRFATGALDGTICTWQLEVGGRSNVHPTESSHCFKSHALDVTYVAGSGSVIIAAGYSTNDVNVVIWDTLAPPTTSQASLICHEGGARSVDVFDNDIGSGSVSPLIVTGGKGGDVGLHDFRFIATGKTKRQRYSNTSEHDTHSGISNKFGEQNSNGMLWYIPKAHLGSVTRIATIPNTSLFLTGSKDGDVKLWDAKRAEIVFHWPKLHERHTFLQPSTRGFGGIVRAGVTDIQVLSHGFLSCGGDGTVKKIQLKHFQHKT